jgi:tetratricopeptide (TPR) repeat protein
VARDAFVGRKTELDELSRAIEDAREGRGSIVLLAGEPGIGKTRLATRAADAACARGARVVWGSCWEGPAAPFWPWVQVLRELSRDVDDAPDAVKHLAGDMAATQPAADAPSEGGDANLVRFALFDAVTTFLKLEASREPLVCVLDDLHWADATSLLLLEFVSREVARSPLIVLGTFRDIELDPSTDRGAILERVAVSSDVIRLRGLDAPDCAELLAANAGALASTEFTRAVHERTGGNPLFVRELARLIAAQRRMPDALPVPEGVKPVIERRLARLTQHTSDFLGVCAAVGNEFRVDVAAAAAGLGLDEAMRALDEATDARLVIASGHAGRYAFSHALVRDVLYEGLSASRRSELHQRIVEAIETRSGSDEHVAELAHHLLQTLPSGDVDRAVEYCVRAGRRALEQLAYEDAVGHFDRALGAVDLAPDADRVSALLLELGDAQLRAGDLPGARATFERAAQLARERARPEDLARAALGFGAGLVGFEVRLGDQRQVELLEEALDALADEDSALRAWVLARLSVARSFQESVAERRSVAEQAIAMARKSGDERALAYALSAHCDAIAGPADCRQRIEEAQEIVRIARSLPDRTMELLGHRLLVVAYLEVGDLTSATASMRSFEIVARALRQPLYLWYVPLWKAFLALLHGEFDQALQLADEAEAVGARAHSENAPMLASVVRWMTFIQRGESDKAPAASEVMLEMVAEYGDVYNAFYEAWILALRGRTDDARVIAERVFPAVAATLPLDSEWLPGICTWCETAATIGATGPAEELYERALPFRDLFGVEGIGAAMHGSVEHYLGLVAAVLDRDVTREHFERAIERNSALGAPVLVARSQLALASFIGNKDPERSAELRREGEATYARFGVRTAETSAVPATGNVFRLEGEFWTVSFGGDVVRIKDAKGLHDIAKLIAAPGREVAALDLHSEIGAPARLPGEGLSVPGHAGELLDDEARAAYKARLAELEEDIEEADTRGDTGTAERARVERDAIAHELSAAYGLGGRARRAGDPSERARTAVTRRIREAISRVADVHPNLGRHLKNSVRTGTFCSYTPEQPTRWRL